MENQKHLFTLDEDVHYLNCAYKAPLLKTAETAAINAIVTSRNPVKIAQEDYFNEVDQAKEGFSQIVNCRPQNVVIIPSTSYGFSTVLKNIKGKENGKAITVENEFPSGYFSLKNWCERNQNDLEIISPNENLKLVGENWNKKLIDAIDANTSVVLISGVHWMTGLKFDLERIGEKCKSVGAKFVVDGSQFVGAVPIDVDQCHIDALICAGYKWLFGPYSVALGYIGETFNEGEPLEESWMNRTNARDFGNLTNYEEKYQGGAGRYNVGETSNFILMPILNEALKQVNAWSVEGIQAYCANLIQPLLDYLKETGIEMEDGHYFSNHLFSLKLPKEVDADLFKNLLTDNKISISVRGESLRISVNVFNDNKDIEKLIELIEIAKTS